LFLYFTPHINQVRTVSASDWNNMSWYLLLRGCIFVSRARCMYLTKY